jgi:hypothetical protein
LNEAKLHALIAQATVDCYDVHEAFWGMLATLQQQLQFPFPAFALGNYVTVVGLDEGHSNERRGIMAAIYKDDEHYGFPLSQLAFGDLSENNADWLAAFQLWSGTHG